MDASDAYGLPEFGGIHRTPDGRWHAEHKGTGRKIEGEDLDGLELKAMAVRVAGSLEEGFTRWERERDGRDRD